jgi:predicted heme/steroid binding protein
MGKGGDSLQVEKSRQIGLEELSEHRTPEDAWMTYKGKVYDVSGWQDHPGEKRLHSCLTRERSSLTNGVPQITITQAAPSYSHTLEMT